MSTPNYKIYVLCEPEDRFGTDGRLFKAGEIRYVGMTTRTLKKRLRDHLEPSTRKKKKSHRYNWINVVMDTGFKPIIELVEDSIVEEQTLKETEDFYADYFKSLGFKLVNDFRRMGNGNISAESRAKASQKNKGHIRTKKGCQSPMKGKKHGPEALELMRQASTGRIKTPETLAKMSASMMGKNTHQKGRINSPQAVENTAKAQRGGKRSPETKAKMAQKRAEWWLKRKEVGLPSPVKGAGGGNKAIMDDLGTEHKSIKAAAETYGVHRNPILNSLKSGQPVLSLNRTFYYKPKP